MYMAVTDLLNKWTETTEYVQCNNIIPGYKHLVVMPKCNGISGQFHLLQPY